MNNTAIGSFFLLMALLGAIFWLGLTGQSTVGSVSSAVASAPPIALILVVMLAASGFYFLAKRGRRR